MPSSRIAKNSFLPRLLKKVQLQGGKRCVVRGVLNTYVAAPRERANAVDGPFSTACYDALSFSVSASPVKRVPDVSTVYFMGLEMMPFT